MASSGYNGWQRAARSSSDWGQWTPGGWTAGNNGGQWAEGQCAASNRGVHAWGTQDDLPGDPTTAIQLVLAHSLRLSSSKRSIGNLFRAVLQHDDSVKAICFKAWHKCWVTALIRKCVKEEQARMEEAVLVDFAVAEVGEMHRVSSGSRDDF